MATVSKENKPPYDYNICCVTVSHIYSSWSKRVNLLSISAVKVNEKNLLNTNQSKSDFLGHIQPTLLDKILGKISLIENYYLQNLTFTIFFQATTHVKEMSYKHLQ